MQELPWEPIYTIERSGQPEVSVSGIISVQDGLGRSLLSVGDVDYQLWSRSCSKPWQLVGHYRLVKTAYPELQPAHLAMMESSHNGEQFHLDLLNEIMAIGGVSESFLKCPACLSGHAKTRAEQKKAGEKARPLNNGCSGKHLGYLLAMKVKGLDLNDYLNPEGDQFVGTRGVLAWLLKRTSTEFGTTTDGCRLPNFALSVREMASLYCTLASGKPPSGISSAPEALRPLLSDTEEMGALMRRFPQLIGGTDRLDTRLMTGQLTKDPALAIVAKEGADGLLTVGIGPCVPYPYGLGIAIKIASGYDMRHYEMTINALLEQLGLRVPSAADEHNKHLATRFHFSLLEPQAS